MKARKNAEPTWVLGHHAVAAVLSTNPQRALELFVVISSRNAAQTLILDQAKACAISIYPVDKQDLTARCASDHHQGVGLRVQAKAEGTELDLKNLVEKLMRDSTPPLLLILDQVQDPHNFGACLRTADAAGVSAVIVAKDNASPITPVVQKVASGAAETMAIFRVTNLARTIEFLKQQGVWIIGTSDKAPQSLYQQDFSAAIAIVMGAEGKGLRQLTAKKCDSLVYLPMAGSVVNSLNVSVAAGVCLFEVVRQRQLNRENL